MGEPWAYLNGRWLPQSQAGLPLHDGGFVLGVTVTDLVRTFRRKLYRWPEHLARFRESCRAVHLNPAASDAELTEAAVEFVRRNEPALPPEGELCLVLFATPGAIGYYAGEPGGMRGAQTVGMHTFPLPFDRYRELVESGAVLRVPQVPQVPAACVPPAVKHRSRMHWWRADHEVLARDSAAKALLRDPDGHVTETAQANFLIVRRGRVVSPPRGKVLPGISLQVVEELCAAEGVPFTEHDLTLEDCLAADEALLCGTAFCLAGVQRLEEHRYPFPGPMLERLLARWNKAVGLDIHGQVRAASTQRRPAAPAQTAHTEPGPADAPTPTSPGDFHQVLSAVAFAARAHEGQVRKDGETPYVSHVFRVCLVLCQRFGVTDPQALQAALLHDTIEDTTTDFDDLADEFSPTVARWAALLTKDKRLPDDEREAAYHAALRQATWQVQVSKLADVYDNLLDTARLDEDKRAKSRRRARSYLDELKNVAHPEVRRCWQIVEALYHGLRADGP